MKITKTLLIVALLALPAQIFAQNTIEHTYNNYFFLEDFHSYDYASVIDFYDGHCPDGILGGSWMSAGDTWSWSHTLPDGWAVPPYQVDAAKIWIDAEWVDHNGNTVEINGLMNWDALNHHWTDNSTYNLLSNPNVDDEFWNEGGGFLNMNLTANEHLRIDEVVFMMDYSVDAAYAAVPEPTTLLLLGLGLAGGAAAVRMRRRKVA